MARPQSMVMRVLDYASSLNHRIIVSRQLPYVIPQPCCQVRHAKGSLLVPATVRREKLLRSACIPDPDAGHLRRAISASAFMNICPLLDKIEEHPAVRCVYAGRPPLHAAMSKACQYHILQVNFRNRCPSSLCYASLHACVSPARTFDVALRVCRCYASLTTAGTSRLQCCMRWSLGAKSLRHHVSCNA